MAKFRKRVKNNKGKRWPKGQSSSSNPSTQTYRNAAQTRFFQPLPGPSMLTMDAVKKHDSFIVNKDTDMNVDDDIETYDGKTFKTFDTFASDWSTCSNQSFNKLINNFKSDSVMHKDMLAVLAAVAEVIKENGGNESSTEYFGALMTALDSEGNTDETVAAIMNLLSMGIKSVPESVLQAKFSESSARLIGLLSKYSESDKTSLLRALLGCLSVLLRVQDTVMWGNPNTIQVLDVILSFITFSKPKVRKAAQHGITVIVRTSKISPAGLAHIAQHCIKLVESASFGGDTITLQTFTLLKEVIHMFPKKELKLCCETVLKVMTKKNVLLTSCGLHVLHGMFLGKPASLPATDAARLLNALYDYQPPVTDSQPTQAWLAVLLQGFLFLAKNDVSLCVANCPKLFTTCVTMFTSTTRPETLTAATHTLQGVIADCLGPASRPDVIPRFQPDLSKIVDILKGCFSYEYHNAWPHVLHLLASIFQACGDTCSSLLLPCVKSLVELGDSGMFTFKNELEHALGIAVRTMGPETIIKVAPFQIDPSDPKNEIKRSWLLPIFQDNIRQSTLKTFIDQFLPLATFCKKYSEELQTKNATVRAMNYQLLQNEIWSLLTSFSNEPRDIAESFPTIAKALGGVLNSRKDLRNIVLSALRKLITFALKEDKKEDLEVLTRYSKNYLPILFVIYTTKPSDTVEEGARLATFETIQVYLKIANQDLRKELFDRAFVKVDNSETDEYVKESVLDLLRALLIYQSREDIEKLYQMIVSKIKDCEEHKKQKKYYRLIESLCNAESEDINNFISDKLETVKSLLIETLHKAAPSCKGPRLRCILALLKRIDEPLEFAKLILPETILCLRDVNIKCRHIAFAVINHIALTFPINEYIHIINAGFTGNPTMMSCSLLAASAIIYHAKDQITDEIEQNLMYCVSLLAVCTTREIVLCALSFLQVFMQTSRERIGSYLSAFMKILSEMNEDCKRHNRQKIRDILSRLVRWFGADELLTHIPSADEVLKKRVRNLDKMQRRKKKQKDAASKASSASAPVSTFSVPAKHKTIEEILADTDSELDDDEEDNSKDKSSKKKKKSQVWITEEPDDIIDFTDTTTTRKITATNPAAATSMVKQSKTKKDLGINIAPDGRLNLSGLFKDDDGDEEYNDKSRKKPIIPGLEDLDESDFSDDEDAFTSYSGEGGVKRPRSTTSSYSGAPPLKYKAGGKGIHRALSTASSHRSRKSNKGNAPSIKTGQEYRAKKAGGDMKRKNMPDPYAYLPLSRDVLNKRKRMKAIKRIKGITNPGNKHNKVVKRKNMK